MEGMTSGMRKALNYMGFNYLNETKRTTRLTALFLLGLAMFLQCLMALGKNWRDEFRRLLACEDLVMTSSITLTLGDLLFNGNVRFCLKVFEDPLHKYNHTSRRTEKILRRGRESCETLLSQIENLLRFIFCNIVLQPLLMTSYVLCVSKPSTLEELYLPHEFGYKFLPVNMYVFLIVYLLQIIFGSVCCLSGYVMNVCIAGAVRRIKMECDLFCLYIEESGRRFDQGQVDIEELKQFTRNLASAHVKICRQTRLLNQGVKFMASYIHQAICFELCLLLYWFTEVDDTFLIKLKDGLMVVATISYMYITSSNGQDLLNEGDRIRSRIYECPWVGMPLWAKKDLLIVLGRSNHSLQLNPFGLYVINFKSFASVLNAAYSYFNVLRSLRKS